MKKIFLIFLLLTVQLKAEDKYTNFNLNILKEAKESGKTIVINSYEPWCWSCRKQDKVLMSAKEEFGNVLFLTYQQGKNKDIAEALNITTRTTIVVFKGRREMTRTVGQTGKSEIYAAIRKGI